MANGKPYERREARLVLEWVQKFFPSSLQWRRVRLGPLPTGKEAQMFSVLRRWADLVFFSDGVVHIVEAKMRPEPGAISQLELYVKLFPETPEFSEYKNALITPHLLTTITDRVVRDMCKERGISYDVYSPEWVKQYLADLIAQRL